MELNKNTELSNSLGIAIVNRNIDLAKSVITELSELEENSLSKVTSRVRENISIEEWGWFQSLLNDGNDSKVIAPLADEDKELKEELETRIIENTKRFFIDTGKDLYTLKQRKLYREQYNSWQSYCQLGLGINPTTASRAIKAYQDCESIRIYFDDETLLPKTDYVLRLLGQIKNVELRANVWRKALEDCGNSPTTSDLRRVYAEIISPEIKPPKPNNLEFKVGDFVSIKEAQVKWGRVVEITSGLRYRIRSGDITSTYQTYQVIPLEFASFIAIAVEQLYQTHSPKLNATNNSLLTDNHPHTKSIATTFYGFNEFEEWQLTLLGSLTNLCQ
jgi:hypothetical protein